MAFRRLIQACLIVALIGWEVPAWGQSACWPRDVYTKTLREKFQEHWSGYGSDRLGYMRVEIWMSKDGATWTIFLVRKSSNIACLVAEGKDWRWAGRKSVMQ